MIARLLGAVQFLTTIPVRGSTVPPGESAIFFPLVGAALGATGALAFNALGGFLPASVAALVTLSLWALLTGGLHEDGFADVADAFRSGRSPERIHAILKDSRIGAHGALALILITLMRWQALTGIAADPLPSFVATLAVSRASLVALAWVTPPAGGGLGFAFARGLTSLAAVAAIVQALLIASLCPQGPLLVWGAMLIVIGAGTYFRRRLGGVTGDCLGATSLVVETWGLVLLSCQRCL